MKKLCLVIFIIVACNFVNAQKTAVRYDSGTLGGNVNPVFIVDIEKTTIKDVEKKWTSFLKDTKGKTSRESDSFFTDNAKIKSVSPDTLDIYSSVKGNGSVVSVSMAVNKDGLFISSNDVSARGVDAFLIEFAVSVKKELAEYDLSIAKKLLETHVKDMERLESTNQKLEKNNAEMKSKIADNEREIQRNEETLNGNKKEIESQKDRVKELEKNLKNIE